MANFRWNPDVVLNLSSKQRKVIADHERNHLQFIKGIPAETRVLILAQIESFELGMLPSPHESCDEGVCIFEVKSVHKIPLNESDSSISK